MGSIGIYSKQNYTITKPTVFNMMIVLLFEGISVDNNIPDKDA